MNGFGAHPFNSPPEHTRRAREIVGPDKWICTAQHVCWTQDLQGGGSDRLIDALVAWGTESQIRDRIQQHFDAGATQVILNTIRLLPPQNAPKILASGVNY